MGLVLVLIVVLVCLLGLPQWEYHSFGYYPSGLGVVLLIVLIVLLLRGG